MKRTVVLAALLLCGAVNAKPVNPTTAYGVAITWMQAMGMKNTEALTDITDQTPFTEFYIFAAPDSGFILISGDDCSLPVLGYSVNNRFETKDIPQHVLSFLSGYEEAIRWCKEHPSSIADTVARQWRLLKDGRMPKAPLDSCVMPLMTTQWDQGTYYNAHCPQDTSGENCYVGCTALAMGQIMHYWNYPATGYGNHSYYHSLGVQSADFGATSYDWGHMPYRLTGLSSPEEVEAVATMLYHAGIAINVNYGIDGSSAYSGNIPSALSQYFKYRPDCFIIYKKYFSNSEFCAILRSELDQNRPVYVAGNSHAFVCDGYTTHNLFHFKMGWAGTTADGFYTADCICVNGSDRYPSFYVSDVYAGIRPNYEWDTAGHSTVTAMCTDGSATVTGSGNYAFGDSVSLQVFNVPEGYTFDGWNDNCYENPRKFTVTGGTYQYTARLSPLAGDTLSYGTKIACRAEAVRFHNYDRWGIRLPGSLFDAEDTLTAVQIYIGTAGTYTLDVCLDNVNNVLYTDTLLYSGNNWVGEQWYTIPLTVPVVIDSTHDLFIAFRCSDATYPTYIVGYCGNQDGSLLGDDLSDHHSNYSWKIRAILGTHDTSGNAGSEPFVNCDTPFVAPYYVGTDYYSFQDNAACWTTLDADGDGYDWGAYNTDFSSRSWIHDTVLTPDNWLFSPAITLPDNLSYVLRWKMNVNTNYPAEHYGVYISTTGTDTADFTLIRDYTPTADDNGALFYLPLDDWKGQTIHIAFRHYNATNQDRLIIGFICILSIDNTVDVYSSNSDLGTVAGSGAYSHGSNVTVVAIPFEGNTFEGWNNGVTDNPYTFTLTNDTVLLALFSANEGINRAETDIIKVYLRDGHIIVDGAENEEVQLFDVTGRPLTSDHYPLPSGVYLIKIGDRPAQKVVLAE